MHNSQDMSIESELYQRVWAVINEKYNGNRSDGAKFFDMAPTSLQRYDERDGIGGSTKTFLKLLDKVGGKVVWPDDPVKTTEPEEFKVTSDAVGVDSETHRAVPVVSYDTAATVSHLGEGDIEKYVLVFRDGPLASRKNLVACQIPKTHTNSAPDLHPGDYIIVDRDDKNIPHQYQERGNLFLVRDSRNGGVYVRRAFVTDDYSEVGLCDREYGIGFGHVSIKEELGGNPSSIAVGRIVMALVNTLDK